VTENKGPLFCCVGPVMMSLSAKTRSLTTAGMASTTGMPASAPTAVVPEIMGTPIAE
jgi:hypothetical protein